MATSAYKYGGGPVWQVETRLHLYPVDSRVLWRLEARYDLSPRYVLHSAALPLPGKTPATHH